MKLNQIPKITSISLLVSWFSLQFLLTTKGGGVNPWYFNFRYVNKVRVTPYTPPDATCLVIIALQSALDYDWLLPIMGEVIIWTTRSRQRKSPPSTEVQVTNHYIRSHPGYIRKRLRRHVVNRSYLKCVFIIKTRQS